MSILRIALIQTCTPADQAAALEHTAPLIREAAAKDARLILTPEGSNLLQRDRTKMLAALRPLEQDPFVQGVRALAAELGVWILIGSALVAQGPGKAANRAVLISAGGAVVQTYDKLHMFDVDLPNGDRYRESALYEPGAEARMAQTPWGPLGLTICYDLRFPQLYRALGQAGAKMIAVPAAFTRPTGEAHWEVLLRARAIETGAFILAPAQGGTHQDGRSTWGHSMAIDPWGRILAQTQGDAPGVVIADLDLDEVDRTRQAIPSLHNERAFSGAWRMIRYALACEHQHEFEGWFGSSADYDDQHARGLLQCPACGTKAVRKAMMAPAVAGTKKGRGGQAMREMAMQAAAEARRQVEENFDYVGDQFAKEARAIHDGKAEERGIYGEATGAQVKALIEDGVPVAPMPPKPPAKTEIN